MVGKPDDLKGQAISAFVTLESGHPPSESLRQELCGRDQGDRCWRDRMTFASRMRYPRWQRQNHVPIAADIAAGVDSTGDTTTLEDLTVLAKLRRGDQCPTKNRQRVVRAANVALP